MDFLAVETSFLDWLQTIRTPFFDSFLVFITKLGDSGIIWIIAGILMLITKKFRRGGVVVLAALLLNLVLGNIVLKNLVARPRPCWVNEDLLLLIPVPRDYSFPSGHTMSAFTAAAAICFTDKKWGIAAIILASAIAFSRLYLYVHYPSDVIAGLILGIIVAFITHFLINQFVYRGKPML